MIFRQLVDPTTSTLSYLLADESTREAVLIDPVYEQHWRDSSLVHELGLHLLATLETHVHADHVTGAWLMQHALGSRIMVARASGAEGFDEGLEPGDRVRFGCHALEVRATPGHTSGCLSYVLHDPKWVFTGDTLLIRGAGRTDFQQGSASTLFHSVREQIFTLDDDYLVYPGHDYAGRCCSSIGEERRFNPRLGDQVREEDFVGYMAHLGLPHPKKLDIAVPANLRCGRPEGDRTPFDLPDWGPVVRTCAGVWQVEPDWVYLNRARLQVIDVREPEEVQASPMGSIEGSRVVPLSGLRQRFDELSGQSPVVFYCPSGARSAMAATIAEKAGIERVANMRGGLLEWRALGLPTCR